MSRRIDIELTSRREDGSFTWRQAGARAPKGIVEASVLPADAKVGDQLKVEVDVFIDGMAITAVIPSRAARAEPERIELRSAAPREDQLITSQLAGRSDRGDRRDRGDRPARGDRSRGDRPRGDRPDGARGARPPRGDGPPRREARPERPKPKRLRPGRTHRRTLIESLPEEQRPIAEELSRGGVAAVRAALETQNQQAKAEGKPEVSPEPLLALAEELWPKMRSAEWLDRAEAAMAELGELDLRDLRSVVVAADSGARDDESRALAAQLREGLNARVESEHTQWLTSLAELVVDGRVVAALRQSSRPPKAGAPLPTDLAELLIAKASESLSADIAPDRWAVVLDALSFSPVRGGVKPLSVPENPSDVLLESIRRFSARVPHIAEMFGVEVVAAPADGRSRGARRGGGPGSGGQGGGGGRGGNQQRPPRPATPTASGATATAGRALAAPADAEAAPAADAAVAAPVEAAQGVVDETSAPAVEPIVEVGSASPSAEASEPAGATETGAVQTETAAEPVQAEAAAEPVQADPVETAAPAATETQPES